MKIPSTPRKTTSAILLASAWAAASLPPLSAQQTSPSNSNQEVVHELADFVVTATRSAKAVDKIPGAITLIPTEEVSRQLMLSDDTTAVLAKSVPGYAPPSEALSTVGETLRGRTALRLFDGIPQSTPLREGNRSASFTDLAIIERIEVINGPSATEGVGATGGIINYISRTPRKPGSETTINVRGFSQFEEDSDGWKMGLTFAQKEEKFDLLMAAAFISRGMYYDGNGRAVGLNTAGSTSDSRTSNLFFKLGHDFGTNNSQRIQATISRFNLKVNGKYVLVPGNRATGQTSTAVRGKPLGGQTEFNDINDYSLSYNHYDLLGGTLTAQAYRTSQAMRFVAEIGSDKQDPLIAPLGTLVEQSEINAQKKGARTSWVRPNLFTVSGLELATGVDYLNDTTQQLLALTNRIWVPPMEYTSIAPYAQLEFERGPVTIRGGVRHEDGELSVESYTGVYREGRQFVTGGTLTYSEVLPNIGVIYRLPRGWSVFLSHSVGFSLPDVGIALRSINRPGVKVEEFVDLIAVLAKNNEAGFTWRGSRGSASISYYESTSDFGSSLVSSPITQDYVLDRSPVEITGWEFSGELRLHPSLTLNGLYSSIVGKRPTNPGDPLNARIGVGTVSPDKIVAGLNWRFSDKGQLGLGMTKYLSSHINQGVRTSAGLSLEEKFTGYHLFDLTASYQTRYGTVALGVENLLNEFYILSTNQVTTSTSSFRAGRGRTVSLSHTVTF